MKKAIVIVGLLAAAGIWTWALWSPKRLPPLPDRYPGVYELYRFEPPEGVVMSNPFPQGQTRKFTFREDGSYAVSILVSGGYEMLRREGVVELDDARVLTLHQYSENRREQREAPVLYTTRWGQDQDGEFLVLQHVEEGYFLYLRPVAE